MRSGIGGLAFTLVLSVAAQAQEAPPPRPGAAAASRAAIPYKRDEDIGASLVRVGVGLAIALGVGVAALAGYKRLVLPQAVGGRRMRLVETLRLGPKAAVFLVEVDGRALLIGQQGETLALLEAPKKAG
jgi:flagellar biogenesis protein FliO